MGVFESLTPIEKLAALTPGRGSTSCSTTGCSRRVPPSEPAWSRTAPRPGAAPVVAASVSRAILAALATSRERPDRAPTVPTGAGHQSRCRNRRLRILRTPRTPRSVRQNSLDRPLVRAVPGGGTVKRAARDVPVTRKGGMAEKELSVKVGGMGADHDVPGPRHPGPRLL
jgi:hypothetical protein